MTKTKKDSLTKAQETLYRYLAISRGRFFNEMCRELEGTLSRRTIAKCLTVLEDREFVKSELVNSNFREHGIDIHRWVRKYTV